MGAVPLRVDGPAVPARSARLAVPTRAVRVEQAAVSDRLRPPRAVVRQRERLARDHVPVVAAREADNLWRGGSQKKIRHRRREADGNHVGQPRGMQLTF